MRLLIVLCITPSILCDYYDSEEVKVDWDDENWEGFSRTPRFTFPKDQDECLGEKMSLRSGETAVIKSHKSFGKNAYYNGYRCRWIFKPIQCDLSLVCYMKTRQNRHGGCDGGDYLRIMKGHDSNTGVSTVDFHKKYCGKRTASLKFSGDETLKLVFKSSTNSKQIPNHLDGWTCKVVCNPKYEKPPPTATSSILDMLATATSRPITTTTTRRTTSTTTVTTSTSPSPSAPHSSCQCGVVSDEAKKRWQQKLGRDGRIICPNGKSCDSEPIPWQVAITSRGRSRPWCGGTIINSQFILSAAHCFEKRRNPSEMLISLGDLDWSKSGEWPKMTVPVQSILLHPKFRKGALYNYDFAILKLERPIDFSAYDWIRPACLPDREDNYYENLTAKVSGWGWTNPDFSSQSQRLQEVGVKIMSGEECVDKYNKNEITDKMICAQSPGADACYGDSGGPMTVMTRGRRVLVGVVSWGRECARDKWPGVYSRVDSVLDWLRDNTRYAEWCASAATVLDRGDRRAG